MFVRESGAGYLLAGLAIVSALLVTLETATRLLEPVRSGIASVVAPIQLIAHLPYSIGEGVGDVVASQDSLLSENQQLERRVLELSQVSQQFLALKAENERLRELLSSRARLSAEVLIAELVSVIPAPDTHQIIIDKGSSSGVYPGQAVIDSEGLFGQVVEVGAFTSRVLLITDIRHALPVEVNRSGVRSIAGGTGRIDQLVLEHVPVTADIREGDLVVSSGLGGLFPRGYPVGRVESVLVMSTQSFAQITVRPSAALDRSRHVLLIFDRQGQGEAPAVTAEPSQETDADSEPEADLSGDAP
ncbi:MAG: rod shape-determining protein MreC [Proteobacteria bacterium]|nr:rod shape-determining protein MreC [Pseudomonadota bacterium]